jgi:phosphate starvation-inducible PhoH-like protein
VSPAIKLSHESSKLVPSDRPEIKPRWANAQAPVAAEREFPPPPSPLVAFPFLVSTGSRALGAARVVVSRPSSNKGALPVAKRIEKQKRRSGRSSDTDTAEIIPLYKAKYAAERSPPPIRPLNPNQAEYLDALRSSPQVIVLGPAGTGKTWIAATHAADLYRARQISKIILTRPNVPCGRSLGFFPGSLEEKFAPWAAPVIEAIRDRIGAAAYEIALKRREIEMVPFEVMRGRSWKDAFVLLDEAQNTTPAEIKMFLTRIGEDCTVVINGDVSQCDLDETSGLRVALDLVAKRRLPVPVIEFTLADIVRSGVCAMWVRAFEEARV